MEGMEGRKDGRSWRIGTPDDVAWLAGRTMAGLSITTAIPPVYAALRHVPPACRRRLRGARTRRGRRARRQTPAQPWWLGYLETGAHDVVFPPAPRVPLYWQWPYVLVEAGPEQALTWRTGHMRGDGSLPDLFFPGDRSWLVSALWDDGWTDLGGSAALIAVLQRDPLVNARPVNPDEDALPPGLTRD